MATVWIIGDSWGTRNSLPIHMRRRHTHLAELLSESGHRVKNCSIPGASNGQTMARAVNRYEKLQEQKNSYPIDYAVWFHTESLRERDHGMLDEKFEIWKLTKRQAALNYQMWKEFIDLTGARDIIIGGQAPVITDLLVHEPYHVIEDWRCELLGVPSIMTHSVCHTDLFEHPNCVDAYQSRMEMLKQNELLVDMQKSSRLFPDNAHPGGRAHQALFERISNLLC